MRYSRQIIFKKIGKAGQAKLNKAEVTIVGAGALGTRVAELLARAGVHQITIIDRDLVDESNLQRQTLYEEADIGKPKADCVTNHLKHINSKIKIKPISVDLNNDNIKVIKDKLVIDCTDNLETRLLLNEYCFLNKIRWIHCAVIGDKGTVYPIDYSRACFRCIVAKPVAVGTCDTLGVMNTAASIVASTAATEALKILMNKPFCKDMIRIDAWNHSITKITIKKKVNCSLCKKRKIEYLSGWRTQKVIKFCGTSNYQIRIPKPNLKTLKTKLTKLAKVTTGTGFIHFKDMTIFKDGRVLLKEKSIGKAKSKVARYLG